MKILFASLLITLASFQLHSQDATSIRKKHFNLEDGIAIEGYDPVAYFKQNKAVKGDKQFAVHQEGVTYYFSSAAYKEEFKKNPSAYQPQYGGWCAYALGAKGEKVSIDPGTFKLVNNKLYLFYNRFFNNTLKSWNKDEHKLKKKCRSKLEQYVSLSKIKAMNINLATTGIWILKLLAAIILLQTLYFKFTASSESVYIFSAIGIEPWGRIGTGILELIAAIMILIPATTIFGALIAIGLMAGAVFFHLTKLGISVQNDGGLLFIYALIVLISSIALLIIYRNDLTEYIRIATKKLK